MNTKGKNKIINSSIYIVFTIIAVTVMCVTLYAAMSFISRRGEKAPVTEPPVSESAMTDAPETKKKDETTDNTPSGLHDDPTKETEGPKQDNPTGAKAVVFRMPVKGYLSKEFSDSVPVYSMTMEDYRVHNGVDLCAEVGAPVYTCADGKITSVVRDPFMGCTVEIDHGSGLISRYCNLSDAEAAGVSVGASVTAGQMIGSVGETALCEIAEFPHLHFELRLAGKVVNPLDYLPYDSEAAEALAYLPEE